MIEEQLYDKNFFSNLQEGVEQSAREIVPLILDLIQPKSVVDVGCGNGVWLSVFKEFGIQQILGIDGEYVSPDIRMIQTTDFLSHDLKQPLQLNQKFDLVVSLEVAEHLPNEYAEIFINSLTSLGSVIMFSAAIPFQGGIGHFNEQWPEYWVKIFKKNGYVVVDCLRKKLWNKEKIEAYYAQNIFLFVKKDCLNKYPMLIQEYEITQQSQISLVHPGVFLGILNWIEIKLSDKNSISQSIGEILDEIEVRRNCIDFYEILKENHQSNE
ncbi:class I SAM-dependent methyltransferase [Nostoc sp. NMS8]|uniref:class I SAM-dependent methyltransferase n=1 Tax=Nostoc sp. NMS8 TaxID=2815392 RepID=UPI0025EAD79F|nr:class I SAM-dependent methyltransferase [Nostoc sp. NMS8]MBN3958471.1 methyltransferase domain-containing protein [Nostoc sp. NMS8]